MIGVVVIGRNEGERLRLCLESAIHNTSEIIYVDSGSTDNSIEIAVELNVNIVSLDMSIPFTASRARNEGFKKLLELYPGLEYVQFIDGDCELQNKWILDASMFLNKNPDVAVVCGRLRERYPSKTIYNKLCDIEWNTPVGETKWCGGIALVRTKAFVQVNGFNQNVIAGEEPDLCIRLRNNGWKIWRIDKEMALHDANIMHFSQWWKRGIRNGYAFALGAAMHGEKPEYHWVNEVRRVWLWGLIIPICIILLSVENLYYLYGLLIYMVNIVRISSKNKKNIKNKWSYALFMTLAKFPEAQGQLKYLMDKISGKRSGIIEYK